jgi:hypothetical protein
VFTLFLHYPLRVTQRVVRTLIIDQPEGITDFLSYFVYGPFHEKEFFSGLQYIGQVRRIDPLPFSFLRKAT